jgi:hypothetical protein
MVFFLRDRASKFFSRMSTDFSAAREQAIEMLSEQAQDDYIGLWQIIGRVRKISPPGTDEELRNLVLEFVKDLLARGFQAVTLASSGPGCSPWPDQDPGSVAGRIESEWKALGREPNVGEIAWFDLRSSS